MALQLVQLSYKQLKYICLGKVKCLCLLVSSIFTHMTLEPRALGQFCLAVGRQESFL